MSEALQSRLSSDQIAEYRDQGFLIFREPVFPKSEFDALHEHFEQELLALAPDVRPESMPCLYFSGVAFFRCSRSNRFLTLGDQILAPDLAFSGSHFICKPKG